MLCDREGIEKLDWDYWSDLWTKSVKVKCTTGNNYWHYDEGDYYNLQGHSSLILIHMYIYNVTFGDLTTQNHPLLW